MCQHLWAEARVGMVAIGSAGWFTTVSLATVTSSGLIDTNASQVRGLLGEYVHHTRPSHHQNCELDFDVHERTGCSRVLDRLRLPSLESSVS